MKDIWLFIGAFLFIIGLTPTFVAIDVWITKRRERRAERIDRQQAMLRKLES